MKIPVLIQKFFDQDKIRAFSRIPEPARYIVVLLLQVNLKANQHNAYVNI